MCEHHSLQAGLSPIQAARSGTTNGTAGDDMIFGTGSADNIYGGDGNDLIYGYAGADNVRGTGGVDDDN